MELEPAAISDGCTSALEEMNPRGGQPSLSVPVCSEECRASRFLDRRSSVPGRPIGEQEFEGRRERCQDFVLDAVRFVVPALQTGADHGREGAYRERKWRVRESLVCCHWVGASGGDDCAGCRPAGRRGIVWYDAPSGCVAGGCALAPAAFDASLRFGEQLAGEERWSVRRR
jgi:hypothetical protein